MPENPTVLLVDNGSLQPAATLNLRRLAAALSAKIGEPVAPVSLLHSSAIEPAALDGLAAEILEPAVRQRYATGVRTFLIVPLFFGPSAALTDYIPQRAKALAETLPGLTVTLATPVVDPQTPDDGRLCAILAAHVRTCASAHRLARPWVILVDHGSPQAAVAAVRDLVGRQLARALGRDAEIVVAASMERREGTAYDFNEPLLARALSDVAGEGIVVPLFFSPGRHAGPGGDIEEICAEAERARPGLRVHLTRLVGEHPLLVAILADRARAASERRSATL